MLINYYNFYTNILGGFNDIFKDKIHFRRQKSLLLINKLSFVLIIKK